MLHVIDLHENHGATWLVLHKGVTLPYHALVVLHKHYLILLDILAESIFCYCILHNCNILFFYSTFNPLAAPH